MKLLSNSIQNSIKYNCDYYYYFIINIIIAITVIIINILLSIYMKSKNRSCLEQICNSNKNSYISFSLLMYKRWFKTIKDGFSLPVIRTSKVYFAYHSEKSFSLIFQIFKIIFERVLNNLSLNRYLPLLNEHRSRNCQN